MTCDVDSPKDRKRKLRVFCPWDYLRHRSLRNRTSTGTLVALPANWKGGSTSGFLQTSLWGKTSWWWKFHFWVYLPFKNFSLRSRESKSSWVWLRTRVHRRRALWNRAQPYFSICCQMAGQPFLSVINLNPMIPHLTQQRSSIFLNPPGLAGVVAEGVRKLGCRWWGEQLYVVDAQGVRNCFSQDYSRRWIRTRGQDEYMSWKAFGLPKAANGAALVTADPTWTIPCLLLLKYG